MEISSIMATILLESMNALWLSEQKVLDVNSRREVWNHFMMDVLGVVD